MLTIDIRFNKMNATYSEPNKNTDTNSELYLLLIVIKLSIFIVLMIGKGLLHLYTCHNEKIINKHDKASIARLQKLATKTGHDLEAGLSAQQQ